MGTSTAIGGSIAQQQLSTLLWNCLNAAAYISYVVIIREGFHYLLSKHNQCLSHIVVILTKQLGVIGSSVENMCSEYLNVLEDTHAKHSKKAGESLYEEIRRCYESIIIINHRFFVCVVLGLLPVCLGCFFFTDSGESSLSAGYSTWSKALSMKRDKNVCLERPRVRFWFRLSPQESRSILDGWLVTVLTRDVAECQLGNWEWRQVDRKLMQQVKRLLPAYLWRCLLVFCIIFRQATKKNIPRLQVYRSI